MKPYNFFKSLFFLAIMLFLSQGCSQEGDAFGSYISTAYTSQDTKILKEDVVLDVEKNISKARYSIDYEIEILKSGELIPLMLLVGADINSTYRIGMSLNGKSQKVLHHDNPKFVDNFLPTIISNFKPSYPPSTLNYIEANISKGKHKVHVDFSGMAGESHTTDCDNTVLYVYDESPRILQHKLLAPVITINNEGFLTKSAIYKDGDYMKITLNSWSNIFSYIMSYLHFLVSAYIAYLLAKSHRDGTKEGSTYKYIFYPFIMIFIFFWLWGNFGCMGFAPLFLFPLMIFILYPLYVWYISDSFMLTLKTLGYVSLFLLLFYIFII